MPKQTKIVISIITITAVVLLALLGLFLYSTNYNYLILKSPYFNYELGYEEVILSNEAVCSPEMKDITKPTISSELLDTNLYNRIEETNSILKKDNTYLDAGKYHGEATLKDQSESFVYSITDTTRPYCTEYRSTIYIPCGIPEADLVNYYKIEDMDKELNIGIWANDYHPKKVGKYDVKIYCWDTSGNVLMVQPTIYEACQSTTPEKRSVQTWVNDSNS